MPRKLLFYTRKWLREIAQNSKKLLSIQRTACRKCRQNPFSNLLHNNAEKYRTVLCFEDTPQVKKKK